MTHGIRSIEDIRQRCAIDDITGCWQWKGAMTASSSNKTPVTWVPELARIVTVIRAVLHFQGVRLSPAVVGWASCFTEGCCAPHHTKHGDRGALGRAIAEAGLRKGKAKYSVAARMPRVTHTPPDIRAQVLASDETGKDLAARLGISPSTVSRLRRGTSYTGAANSSVFSWRGAA